MKKVGILTFPNSPSFGASLQMYALYTALAELGYNPEIINYINPFMKSKSHIGKVSFAKSTLIELMSIHGRRMFRQFESELKKYPTECIHSKEALASIADRYDYLICGSDQVWNPLVTGYDYSYLFDFCLDNRKKISYAPSFGLEELPEGVKENYSKFISQFYALSVRERSGARIVKDLIGIEPTIVVDPSMLISKDKWESMMIPYAGIPANYIVKFIFNERGFVNSFCKDLANKHDCHVITIGGIGPGKNIKNGYTGPIGPQEWLSIIHNADYVVTDSFHGAAFSIIFNKQVYISLESSTKSRLEMLVNTFDLHSRTISPSVTPSESEILYDLINSKLQEKRNMSIEFLKASMI